jgi:hypothetical protein
MAAARPALACPPQVASYFVAAWPYMPSLAALRGCLPAPAAPPAAAADTTANEAAAGASGGSGSGAAGSPRE